LDSTPFTIQNTGGVTTFSISPDLPNGLALNTVTGEISGRPTVPITNTLFTITASNAVGTATVFFRLFIDLDTDGDGIGNQNDLDIDGDGIPNNSDSDINGDGTIDNGTDMDDDGINDTNDSDIDGDGIVNDADADINGDGTIDNGADIDADGINDANDSDIDGDGISNYKEGYNYTIPGNSLDTDRDGIPDYRDADSDNDTVLDQYDVFPTDKTEYIDSDGDGIGNNADTDDDNDGILDYADIDSDGDNIPDNGIDMDGDGINDANDPDMDGDGISNAFDNCPITPNTNQADRDHDGIGDGCDFTELNVVNAITPNGDGINDAWFIYNIENHPNSIIRVFNINGSEVFYSNDYHNDWDGRYKNFNDTLPLLSSYFYQIDLEGDGTIDNEGWLYITK
jgi:gliding motility-associated-like protein